MHTRLAGIPGITVIAGASLADCTRFGVGGKALWLVDASTEQALAQAVPIIRESGLPFAVIGGGSNLVASDDGFAGVVLRYTDNRISIEGTRVRARSEGAHV